MRPQSETKTISDEKYKEITAFIVKQVEPRINTIVESLNDYFKKKNIRVGVELKWLYDEINSDDKKEESNEV